MRVVQAVLAGITRLAPQVMQCVRVVTHPQSQWRLWDLGPRTYRWMLLTEAIVVAWAAVESGRAVAAGVGAAGWGRFALLLGVAAAYIRGTKLAEERRRGRHADATHVDHTSLIFFTGALLLPVPLALALIGLVRGYRWLIARKPPSRFIYATAGIWLSALGVHLVAEVTSLQDWMTGRQEPTSALESGAGAALLGAVAVYFLAQAATVGTVRGLVVDVWDLPRAQRPRGWRRDLRVEMYGTTWDNAEIVVTLLIAMGISALAALWLPLLLLVVPIGVALSVVMRLIDELRQLVDELRRRLEEVRQKADIDGKTGLLTLAAFTARAHKVIARARRSGSPVSVLIIDIDFFKRVNDTYGHFAGDEVLKAVADRLREAAREGDEVCRFGGEEMLILLPDTDLDLALVVAERVRSEVEVLDVPVTAAKGGNVHTIAVTVSVGVASVPTHGPDLNAVMQQADVALYAAKTGGRNQVRRAVPDADASPAQTR